MPTFRPEVLQEFCQAIVAGIGAGPAESAIVAEHLIDAMLAGHDSHGVIRLPQYLTQAREGKLAVGKAVVIERETSTTALLNGNYTWGPVIASRAMDIALGKAQAHGMSAVGVRQCHHVGRVGVYPMRAAKAGFIAKVWCNGHGVVRVAPWGGVEPRLATNPIAIAIPTAGDPVLVDITTSVVAEGKVRLAKNKGSAIPAGWVLNRQGDPTTNPSDLYEGGTLLPMGGDVGHKGFALSLIVDLLGGVLTGAGSGVMPGVGVGNGLFIEVVDPTAFLPRNEFLARVDDFLAYIKSSPTKPGVSEILLPGEPELRTARQRRQSGLPVDDETWKQMIDTARKVGVGDEIINRVRPI